MKTDRSAFLYMEPTSVSYGSPRRFAQCETCMYWVRPTMKCLLHSSRVNATEDTTCGLYVNGEPQSKGKPLNVVTPKISGAARLEARCENCTFFASKKSRCRLFEAIMRIASRWMTLNDRVHKHGCCNAMVPRVR